MRRIESCILYLRIGKQKYLVASLVNKCTSLKFHQYIAGKLSLIIKMKNQMEMLILYYIYETSF